MNTSIGQRSAGNSLTASYGDPWGFAIPGTTTWTLERAASSELTKAQMGVTLNSVHEVTRVADMYTGAANDIGARFRAAYWQAVASRIAQARGKSSTALTLAAASTLGRANVESTSGTIFSAFGAGRSDTSVAPILLDAAERAEAAGIPEVGTILRQLAVPNMTAARQKEMEGQSLKDVVTDSIDPRPDWMKNTGKYVLWGGVSLALLGGIYWWSTRR